MQRPGTAPVVKKRKESMWADQGPEHPLRIVDIAERVGVSPQVITQRARTLAIPMDGTRQGKRYTVKHATALKWLAAWERYIMLGDRKAQHLFRQKWNEEVVKENIARGYVRKGDFYDGRA